MKKSLILSGLLLLNVVPSTAFNSFGNDSEEETIYYEVQCYHGTVSDPMQKHYYTYEVGFEDTTLSNGDNKCVAYTHGDFWDHQPGDPDCSITTNIEGPLTR